MGRNLLIQRCIMVGVILVLVGTDTSSATAKEVEISSFPPSRGNWLYVGGDGPGNYTNIQDAIDNANEGDTVFVFHGTYSGFVVLNKSIYLIGEDKNTTRIIGFFAYTISIVSDWVTMSGFTILNEGRLGEGVRIDSCYNTFSDNIIDMPNDRIRIAGDSNTISGNTVTNCYIYLSGETNTISGNIITNKDYGIYVIDSWDNIILNNSFFNSGLFFSLENICENIVMNNTVNGKPLVYVYDKSDMMLDTDAGQIICVNCTNITVQNQEICNTTIGIQIVGSNSCVLSDNTIAGNYYAISVSGWNNTITSNTITNNSGIIHLSGDSNTISNNIISYNAGGIYLDSTATYNTIIDNTIKNTYESIQLDFGSDFNRIINNTVTNNSGAIRISSDNNTIYDNTISNNNDDGIYVFGDSNTISGNIIAYTLRGIILLCSNHNTILDNIISNNRDGIYFDQSYDNNIANNFVTSNYETGVFLKDSHNNLITGNNISGNDAGITLENSRYNQIHANSIRSNNDSGIELNASSEEDYTYNSIRNNIIESNTQGIYLKNSGNNTILENTFLRNKRHVLFENCTNMWNKNFWGRPRILPKLIFGTIEKNSREVLWFNIDWHPARKPNEISGMM